MQLGAYESAGKADELIRDLRARGIEAFHQRAEVNGRTWYRVRVGIYASRAEAEGAAQRLIGASPFDPYVAIHP